MVLLLLGTTLDVLATKSQDMVAEGQKVFDHSELDIVTGKKDLVETYKDNAVEMSEAELVQRAQYIESVIADLSSRGYDQDDIALELENYGVFRLNSPSVNSDNVLYSEPADVVSNQVSIFFDSLPQNWVVYGSGAWVNDNWFDDMPGGGWTSKGQIKNLGNFNAVGITYYNTSGRYDTRVVSSYANIMSDKGDENGNTWNLISTSPSSGDGQYGVSFQFQDKVKLIGSPWQIVIPKSDFSYLGASFNVMITYDKNFTNWNGNARAFYVHTWDEAVINKISFNVSGKEFGVEFDISNSNKSYPAFSNRDTSF